MYLEGWESSMNQCIRLEQSKDGNEILVVIKNGLEYRLNSTYHPIAEAEKFAKKFEGLEENSLLFVFGFGNGIFAEEIIRICKEKAIVVFYEPSKDIYEYLCMKRNMQEYCDSHSCYFVTDGIQERIGDRIIPSIGLFDVMERITTYKNRNHMYQCALPKYVELFPEEYDRFRQRIEQGRMHLFTQIFNVQDHGHKAVVNNVKLLQYIPECYCLENFIGLFPKDMPAIVVSAGPSLEKNIDLLKKAKGRALIVCVDSAIKYMLHKKIIPDLLISFDIRKNPELFEDKILQDIPIFGSTDMNIEVLEVLQPKKFILAGTANPYVRRLFNQFGYAMDKEEFDGSVAGVACDVLRRIGFQTIILIGQDLALTGNQMYAGDGELLTDSFTRTVVDVESVDGGTVKTTLDYYEFIKWFERYMQQYPELKLVDATEGGARLRGAETISFSEAIQKYMITDYNVQKILDCAKPAFTDSQRELVKADLCQEKLVYKDIVQKMKKGMELAEQGNSLANGQIKGKEEWQEKIDEEILQLCQLCDTMDEFILIQDEIASTELDAFDKVFDTVNSNSSVCEYYCKLKEYFKYMYDAAKSVYSLFEGVNFYQ